MKKKNFPWGKGLALAALGVVGFHLKEGISHGNDIQYLTLPFASPKVTDDLVGYTIAFVTDVHTLSRPKLRTVVREINKHSPHLLLLGGDYETRISTSWGSLKELAQVKTVDGIYGVDGNHDNAKDLFIGMKMFGMHLLDNAGKQIRPGLFVGGVADYEKRMPSVYAALEHSNPDDLIILLSHNPDITMVQDIRKADLTISGHIHGGEVALFGKYAPALAGFIPRYVGATSYGQRFRTGWCQSKIGTPVYVSNGVGQHTPLRMYAPPQVIFFRLEQP